MRNRSSGGSVSPSDHWDTPPVADLKGDDMPSWLLILIVGVLLLVFGVAVEAARFLIWLGIIVLVVSLILGLVGRGRRSGV